MSTKCKKESPNFTLFEKCLWSFSVWLTARRSPYYAAAYAANDVVLIVMWSLAAMRTPLSLGRLLLLRLFGKRHLRVLQLEKDGKETA